MDPMTEIFYEESSGVLDSLRRSMRSWNKETVYGQSIIMEIFRGVHTLKADSSMMLYENMSVLSRQYESLLYCFRGEDKTVKDIPRFISVLDAYLAFFEQETDKLAQNKQADGDPSALLGQIVKYTTEMKKQMAKEEEDLYQNNINQKSRPFFYIAGATEQEQTGDASKQAAIGLEGQPDVREIPDGKMAAGQIPSASVTEETAGSSESFLRQQQTVLKRKASEIQNNRLANKKRYQITEAEKQNIFKSVRSLHRLIGRIECTQDDHGNGMITKEQVERLEEIYDDLCFVKQKLNKTDFVPVAGKLEALVDEMCMRLDKHARILIKGVQTTVDYETREKISSALTHMVRNSMDHGIESMEERELLGKAPVGLIKVRFTTEDNRLKIVVKDDGRGLETDKIMEKAAQNGLLKRSVEEYTEAEIHKFIFESGLSTKDVANEYSGHGVGMDVVVHNITELGGKIKVRSVQGEGTTITIKI